MITLLFTNIKLSSIFVLMLAFVIFIIIAWIVIELLTFCKTCIKNFFKKLKE